MTDRLTKSTIALSAIVAELVILWLVKPQTFVFAFNDSGANLTVQYLISHGLTPTVDFGYHYGLLPLLLGKCWFWIFGMTPCAYGLAQLVCSLLVGVALWRASLSLNLGSIGLAFIVITAGWGARSVYPNFAHGLEAVLIANALAEQAASRLPNAMTLSLLAALAKPAMGYLYFVLLLGIVFFTDERRGAIKLVFRTALQALVVFFAVAMLLSFWFGARAAMFSLTPIAGAEAYRTMRFGFIQAGQTFWHPNGARWGYYVWTFAGFWLLGSVIVILQGLRAASAGACGPGRDQITVTCAILHALFFLFLFATGFSVFYYPYILTLGMAAGANDSIRVGKITLATLAVLSVLAWRMEAGRVVRDWRTRTPRNSMAGLWADDEQANEWDRALDSARGHTSTVLSALGCASLLSDEFEPPPTLFLIPGLAKPLEIEREVAMLRHVSIVVVPVMSGWGGVPYFPALKDEMRNRFELLWQGQVLSVYRAREG